MTTQATALSTPTPSRSEPAFFSPRMDVTLSELPVMITQLNAMIVEMNAFAAAAGYPNAGALYDAILDSGLVRGRNRFVNGAYTVSQINADTAHTITAGAAINYGIDCLYTQCTGQNIEAQRIAGAGAAGFKYGYKLTAGATGPTTTLHGERFKGADCVDLVNQNVAVQVSVNFGTATSRVVTWRAYYANTEDNFAAKTQIATGTFDAGAGTSNHTITFNAGANAGNGLCIEYSTGAITAGGFIIYSGHQLEKIPAGATIGTEFEHVDYATMLRRCQRYFQVIAGIRFAAYASAGMEVSHTLVFPVVMRATPTFTVKAAGTFTNCTGSVLYFTNWTAASGSLRMIATAAGLVQVSDHVVTAAAFL